MSSRIISCRQRANNAVSLNSKNTEWLNIYDEPLHIAKGSILKPNYIFLNSDGQNGETIQITDQNNVFNMSFTFYVEYMNPPAGSPAGEIGSNVYMGVYVSPDPGDDTLYENTLEFTLEPGLYTPDRLSLLINEQMINSEVNNYQPYATRYPYGATEQAYGAETQIVESPCYKFFQNRIPANAQGYFGVDGNHQGDYGPVNMVFAGWGSSPPATWQYAVCGANEPSFTWNPTKSRFEFTFLHQPYVRSRSKWKSEYTICSN